MSRVQKIFQEEARTTNSPAKKSTLISCICHMCGKSFKMKSYVRNFLQKKHLIFFVSKFKISTFQTSFTKSKTSRNEKFKQQSHSSQETLSFTALGILFEQKEFCSCDSFPKWSKVQENLVFDGLTRIDWISLYQGARRQ